MPACQTHFGSRYTRPPFITKMTRRTLRISSSGFPAVATRLCFPRAPQHIGDLRQRFLHESKSLFVVIADAEKLWFVIEVIVEYQKVRIEVGTAISHELQNVFGQECSMLNRLAAGEDRGPRCARCVRMYCRPPRASLLLCRR